MVQKFYDSESAALREFVPLKSGEASLYYCGATVQAEPHLGHVRSALVYDQIRRWLEFQGLKVTVIRNVTDIDDKILANARESGEPWWALAARNERKFTEIYGTLNILPPTYEPRATGHMPEMWQLIRKLIDGGHAYAADDGSGDVYFDVSSFDGYGGLTHQRIEDMQKEVGADSPEVSSKRSPYDFALWKGAKPQEPADASWLSPWGSGRPGWHLECSAMSERYLGRTFDIHGGGLDLRFPHHENERAQSKAAGAPFANFWLHNGLVTYQGEKMSKSVGNVVSPAEMLKEYLPLTVRYYLGSAQYRSVLDYHPGALEEAKAAVQRIRATLRRAEFFMVEKSNLLPSVGKVRFFPSEGELTVPAAFREALEDDMNVPAALAVIHEHLRPINVLLEKNGSAADVEEKYAILAGMLDILGINPSDSRWIKDSIDYRVIRLKKIIAFLITFREKFRSVKDWEEADGIRDFLQIELGIILKDGPGGTTWSFGDLTGSEDY